MLKDLTRHSYWH